MKTKFKQTEIIYGRIKTSTKQNSLRAPYGTLSAWFYLLNSKIYLTLYKLFCQNG